MRLPIWIQITMPAPFLYMCHLTVRITSITLDDKKRMSMWRYYDKKTWGGVAYPQLYVYSITLLLVRRLFHACEMWVCSVGLLWHYNPRTYFVLYTCQWMHGNLLWWWVFLLLQAAADAFVWSLGVHRVALELFSTSSCRHVALPSRQSLLELRTLYLKLHTLAHVACKIRCIDLADRSMIKM